MKILFVLASYAPRWGGAENQARSQAEELVRRGHAVDVVTWRHDPSWPRYETLGGVDIRRVDRLPGRAGMVLSALTMCTVLARRMLVADVTAAHMILPLNYLAGIIAAVFRRPIVVKAAINACPPDSGLAPLLARGIEPSLRRVASLPLRRFAVAIAMTDAIEHDLRLAGFRRIVRIPNGVVDNGRVDRTALRQRLYDPLGISADALVVATAGRFLDWKGFHILIEAWTTIVRQFPGAQLVLVGSGPYEEQLRSLVAKFDLSRCVTFVPETLEARLYLAAADAIALPSFYEGMSNVLLEAMASGLPVVSSAVSGAVDLIRNGQNGYLVPPGDVAVLERALHNVLSDPANIGARGRATVLARCSMVQVVDLYETLFARCRALPEGTTRLENLGASPKLPMSAS